jgi:hypothetical protein
VLLQARREVWVFPVPRPFAVSLSKGERLSLYYTKLIRRSFAMVAVVGLNLRPLAAGRFLVRLEVRARAIQRLMRSGNTFPRALA